MSDLRSRLHDAEGEVLKVFRGDPQAVRLAMLTLLSRGHLLIEDVPGIGKTTLALALARVFQLEFRRIQMTADLLPADIVGVSIFDPNRQVFQFYPGPIFAQVLLIDELNRATPKTQSALLEAMAEGAVSVDGQRRHLPDPYVVLATQNPIEQVGTFPLPESQLDRFLMRIGLGYPDVEQEVRMLQERRYGEALPALTVVLDAAGVRAARDAVAAVQVHDDIARYVVALAAATRTSDAVALGVSPRGSLALLQVARANAWMAGRDFVVPEDVYELSVPVLAHRILPRDAAMAADVSRAAQESLLRQILDTVAAPV